MLRGILLANFVAAGVAVNLGPRGAGAMEPVSRRAVAAASTVELAFAQAAHTQGAAILSVAQPPPAPAVAEAPAAPAAAPLAWAPPSWFPAESRAELWALEGVGGEAERSQPPVRLRSRAAFVYDLDAGRVLLAYGADARRPVASLTKLVSALTLMSESPQLDREICLDNAIRPSWPGAVSRLRYGACTRGWDLLGAALVRSDNGAALGLAVVSGLPLAPFVDRMNEVAGELGMDMSSFVEPSGILDENLSTARDMTRAVISAALHPVIAPVASAPYWEVEYTTGKHKRMKSTDKLLGRADLEVLSAKTGYTDTALHCFSAVVRTASGRTLALTTLGAERSRYRWSDVSRLIRWAERGT